ncbi:MAG: hypothetical protein ACLS8J_01720 [Streptococcus salivarius]
MESQRIDLQIRGVLDVRETLV